MEPDSSILVTGATGFIGTRLVEALVKRGHRVRALSRRENPAPPPGFQRTGGDPLRQDRVELVRGDIADRESLDRAVEGCDYVFHLAAYAKNWAPSPRTYYEMNLDGMRNVFDAATPRGRSPDRLDLVDRHARSHPARRNRQRNHAARSPSAA